MNSLDLPIKHSIRTFCIYCIKEKKRSKTFRKFHSLKYHIKSEHQGDNSFPQKEVYEIIQKIEKAVEMGMIR